MSGRAITLLSHWCEMKPIDISLVSVWSLLAVVYKQYFSVKLWSLHQTTCSVTSVGKNPSGQIIARLISALQMVPQPM